MYKFLVLILHQLNTQRNLKMATESTQHFSYKHWFKFSLTKCPLVKNNIHVSKYGLEKKLLQELDEEIDMNILNTVQEKSVFY